MIIECGEVVIDTELDHEVHKDEIQKHTSFFCDKHDPKQWFTQVVDDYTRFYQLHYNNDGSALLKITSWDRKKDNEQKMKMVKKLKNASNDDCYFSMRKKDAEYEWVEERDTLDISKNHMTHWNRAILDRKRLKLF